MNAELINEFKPYILKWRECWESRSCTAQGRQRNFRIVR
jgi:hypothetical protein